MKISYSRASSYAHCPYGHYLRYVERIEHKAPVKALRFGGDFHKLLQYRHNSVDLKKAIKEIRTAYNGLTPEQQSILGDNYINDLRTVFNDYRNYWKDSEIPIESELDFELPIGTYKGESIVFKGLIDEVYKDEDGYYIGEHKTFSVKPNLDILTMNAQICLYAKAIEIIYGQKPYKVLWDYIRSSPASEPVWLEKSQRFSEATSDKITPYSFIRALKSNGVMVYPTELTQKYEANFSNFFFRVPISFVPAMIDNIWNDFVSIAKEIVLYGEKNKRRRITRDCTWCSYRSICYAEFTGADVNYIKEKDYISRVEEENETVIVDE